MSVSVLVVDDDPEFHDLVRPPFAAAGWTVAEATNANGALVTLEKAAGDFAAAIIDLHLPGMSGFDLIREVATRYPRVRILAVSAIYREFYLQIAENVGAHVTRRKSSGGLPVSGEEWTRVVAQLLERTDATQ